MTRLTILFATALTLAACAGIPSGDDSFKYRKSGVSSERVAGN